EGSQATSTRPGEPVAQVARRDVRLSSVEHLGERLLELPCAVQRGAELADVAQLEDVDEGLVGGAAMEAEARALDGVGRFLVALVVAGPQEAPDLAADLVESVVRELLDVEPVEDDLDVW